MSIQHVHVPHDVLASYWRVCSLFSSNQLLNVVFSGLLLPWCGFMFGCFTSILLRRSPADVTAIAVETGIQNTGIAILLLKASFSQPDSDIGAVIPVIVACFTPIPLLCGAGIHHMMKSFKKRRQSVCPHVCHSN